MSAVKWQSAPTKLTKRSALVEVYGDTGTGRTTWALSAPGPIAFLHASEKIEGIIQPHATKIGPNGDGTGGVFDFGGVFIGSDQEVARQAGRVWAELTEAWYDALTWARTLVLDTHTEAWELIRLARFGGLKPSGGRVDANYGPVNAEFRSLFKAAKQQDGCNVIVIGQTKDEYKGSGGMGQRTGKTIRAGMKEIPFYADVIVRTESELLSQSFTSTIEKPWWNSAMMGLELEGEMSNFTTTMELVTEVEDGRWAE